MKHIIIDANNLMRIAMGTKSISEIPLDEEDETSVRNYENSYKQLFGRMITGLQHRLGYFNKYYAIWDSKGGSAWRKKLNENYKSNRTYDGRLVLTTKYANQIFEENMIPQFSYETTEADDLMFALAENISKDRNQVVTIVTRDQDLIQAVQRGVASEIYNPVTKKPMNIPDYDMVLYKCLVGDSSDNIKGVKGVGPKTAKKMLAEGVDPELIKEFYQIINIPSNPRYEELLQVTKEFYEKQDEETFA